MKYKAVRDYTCLVKEIKITNVRIWTSTTSQWTMSIDTVRVEMQAREENKQ